MTEKVSNKHAIGVEQFINLNLVDSGNEALYHPNRLQNTRVLPRFVSSFLTVII